jgi:hypothetical protein
LRELELEHNIMHNIMVISYGRKWKAAQLEAINVTLIIDPTPLGQPEREIEIRLHILRDLCVDVILGVPAIHDYNLWPILMAQIRSRIIILVNGVNLRRLSRQWCQKMKH